MDGKPSPGRTFPAGAQTGKPAGAEGKIPSPGRKIFQPEK
jgi:hypothetical protein